MGASSGTVGFHDIFGAVGLVSERVVCADAAGPTLCVRPCYWYLPCRVDRTARLSLLIENYQRTVGTKI